MINRTDWWILDRAFAALAIVLVVLAACIPVIVWKTWKDERRECGKIMAMARTNHDSITIALRCRLGSDRRSNSEVVPMPIVVPLR